MTKMADVGTRSVARRARNLQDFNARHRRRDESYDLFKSCAPKCEGWNDVQVARRARNLPGSIPRVGDPCHFPTQIPQARRPVATTGFVFDSTTGVARRARNLREVETQKTNAFGGRVPPWVFGRGHALPSRTRRHGDERRLYKDSQKKAADFWVCGLRVVRLRAGSDVYQLALASVGTGVAARGASSIGISPPSGSVTFNFL